MNELISVVMSVYNEKLVWIEESVDSILNQTYTNLELLLIVDNPNLEENIKEYLRMLCVKDSRVVVLYNDKNIGLALSLNKGIQFAKGEYIARMDADDISEKKRLEIQMTELKKRNVDCIGSGKILIDETSEVVSNYENVITGEIRIKKILPYVNCFVHPSMLIKKSSLHEVGGYRNFRQSQDYDLWLRLNDNECRFDNVDMPLIKYRIRKDGITGKKPYVQYLTSKYERLLHKERLQKNKDSFSEEGLLRYLEKYKAYDEKKNVNYQRALLDLNKGISMLRKNALQGAIIIIRSMILCRDMLEVFYGKIRAVYYRTVIK